jgi:hypothetical protein
MKPKVFTRATIAAALGVAVAVGGALAQPANPCAARNPAAQWANPCQAKNPCAATNPCAARKLKPTGTEWASPRGDSRLLLTPASAERMGSVQAP